MLIAYWMTVAGFVALAIGRSLPKRNPQDEALVPVSSNHWHELARSDAGNDLFKRTDAYPYTNDQAVTIGVGRLWFYGLTAQQVTDNINLYRARITQIRVNNPNVPTFTVTMVINSGSYASAWWWYFGQDATQLGTLLQGRRLISLEPYYTSSGLRFAAVMVPNSGMQGRAWWWYYGHDTATVTRNLEANQARLVSARPYRDTRSGRVVYAVIMISNTGVDTKGWQWLPGRTISDISAAITTYQQRVVAFTPNPGGNFDAILVNSEGEGWWWWYGLDATAVGNNLVNHNTRLIDIAPYLVNGATRFAIVELDDSNPEQAPINAESVRVRKYAEANGWRGGFHGTYAIESSGNAGPIVAYNSHFRFEPASSIKVLYLLYTLKRGASLTSPITYYWSDNTSPPPPGVCPLDVPEIPANAHTVSIGDALIGMMKSSNNVYTRAFAKHWGTGPVQAMATSLGMSSTFLRQPYIGCGFRGSVRNEVSLVDFATLYRAVDSGSALPAPVKQIFLDTLFGGPGWGGSAFKQVVAEEAASVGRSSHVSEFMSALDVRSKGGSYGWPLAPVNTSKVDYSVAGYAFLPFKNSAGAIEKKTYLFGTFVNDFVFRCPPTPTCPPQEKAGNLIMGNAAEALRSAIRQALLTWPANLVPEDFNAVQVDSELEINDNFKGWMDWMPGGEWMRWAKSIWST